MEKLTNWFKNLTLSHQALETYSGSARNVIPSAPIVPIETISSLFVNQDANNFEESDPFREDEIARMKRNIVLESTWEVACNFTLFCQRRLVSVGALLDLMSLWLDQYEGPTEFKSILTGLYLLSGVTCNYIQDSPTSIKYSSDIYYRVTFHHNKPELIERKCTMHWEKFSGSGPFRHRIRFQCDMRPTNRRGKRFPDIWHTVSSEKVQVSLSNLLSEFKCPHQDRNSILIFK